MAGKRTGQALYITLIDFLIQLIFLGLVIGVVYSIGEQEKQVDRGTDTEKIKSLEKTLGEIKKTSGISDITILTDQLTRLGPLSEVEKRADIGRQLESSISEAGGIKNAKRLIDEQIQKGQGKPSCLANQQKVATVHAYEERLEISGDLSADLLKLLNELNVKPAKVKSMSFQDFSSIFRPVLNLYSDCRFNITVVEYTPYKKPRDVVRQFFYTTPIDAGKR